MFDTTKCLLTLVALSVRMTFSWDIAMIHGNSSMHELGFYSNNTQLEDYGTSQKQFTKLSSALTYDAVHNSVLFAGPQQGNQTSYSIFAYNLATREYQTLVNMRKTEHENIVDIAFDPVKRVLFWIYQNKPNLYKVSVKSGTQNNDVEVINLDGAIPGSIAVDSCRGYIYWTNTNSSKNSSKYKIERCRYDGSEKKVIIQTDKYKAISLAIAQFTNTMYWVELKHRSNIYKIKSIDLDTNNTEKIFYDRWNSHQIDKLTISEDFLYLEDKDCHKVWKLPKNPTSLDKPEECNFHNGKLFGIAANYQIQNQAVGHSVCKAVNEINPLCKNGVKMIGENTCKCKFGYMGAACDLPTCHNFCFAGICTVSEKGEPKCSCPNGFTGERCDVSVCANYCSSGNCTVSESGHPRCSCPNDFTGERCDVSVCANYCSLGNCTVSESGHPRCSCSNGFTGERCDVSACDNYCYAGNCTVTENGRPKCSCSDGFSGERCEGKGACHEYCLNNGTCSLNEDNVPVCHCDGLHDGSRCETLKLMRENYSLGDQRINLVQMWPGGIVRSSNEPRPSCGHPKSRMLSIPSGNIKSFKMFFIQT